MCRVGASILPKDENEGKMNAEVSQHDDVSKGPRAAMPPKPPTGANTDPVNWLSMTVDGVIVKVLQRGCEDVVTLGRTGRGKGTKYVAKSQCINWVEVAMYSLFVQLHPTGILPCGFWQARGTQMVKHPERFYCKMYIKSRNDSAKSKQICNFLDVPNYRLP